MLLCIGLHKSIHAIIFDGRLVYLFKRFFLHAQLISKISSFISIRYFSSSKKAAFEKQAVQVGTGFAFIILGFIQKGAVHLIILR
jgi:hypothetical protein